MTSGRSLRVGVATVVVAAFLWSGLSQLAGAENADLESGDLLLGEFDLGNFEDDPEDPFVESSATDLEELSTAKTEGFAARARINKNP